MKPNDQEYLDKLKEAIDAIEWYMKNTKPLYSDWQTFHDLGMNIIVTGLELINKTDTLWPTKNT